VPEENPHQTGRRKIREVVIPRSEAVFWLDSRGYWRNSGGRFRKKKIVDHFHSAISRDENGYFVAQRKPGPGEEVREKVYFPYEDTALFVFAVCFEEGGITLVLNTGRRLFLKPGSLFVKNDSLYLREAGEVIKFSERALIQMAGILTDHEGALHIRVNGRLHPIADA
jgi:hypothetical protein